VSLKVAATTGERLAGAAAGRPARIAKLEIVMNLSQDVFVRPL
jgi:hypothetical protein